MTDPGTFIIFRRLTMRGHRWFFRAVAGNGEIVAQSQPYRDKSSAYGGIASLRRIGSFGDIREEP